MLDVVGEVQIEFGGSSGRLLADGRAFVLDIDEPAVLAGVVGLGTLRTLTRALSQAGYTLHVRSGGDTLLRAGRNVEAGWLGRLLRLPGTRLDPRFALRSAFRRGMPRR